MALDSPCPYGPASAIVELHLRELAERLGARDVEVTLDAAALVTSPLSTAILEGKLASGARARLQLIEKKLQLITTA